MGPIENGVGECLTTNAGCAHRLNEAAVDLEPVERDLAEMAKARVAGAEIVEGDADAGGVKCLERAFCSPEFR